MYDVSGLYPLQQSLVIWSYVKMLVRRVLPDRSRITQEKSQYQGVFSCSMLVKFRGICRPNFGLLFERCVLGTYLRGGLPY